MIHFDTYQSRVWVWLTKAFGLEIISSRIERNHRFLEEACEVVQANGMTVDDALDIVEFVFSRPAGEIRQEIGGALNTLAALSTERGVNMEDAAEAELKRCWDRIDDIRRKQATKPKHRESVI